MAEGEQAVRLAATGKDHEGRIREADRLVLVPFDDGAGAPGGVARRSSSWPGSPNMRTTAPPPAGGAVTATGPVAIGAVTTTSSGAFRSPPSADQTSEICRFSGAGLATSSSTGMWSSSSDPVGTSAGSTL